MNPRLIVLALVIGCFVMGFAADVSAQAATKSAPAGGPREGIKVHGDWVIEIRNPDGSLATRREFKNALTRGNGKGDQALAEILSRVSTVRSWTVGLSGEPEGPCGVTTFCSVVESDSILFGAFVFKTLTVARNGVALVLNGSATASNASGINRLFTALTRCNTSECVSDLFTIVELSPAITVVAGQIIQVTVTISFS